MLGDAIIIIVSFGPHRNFSSSPPKDTSYRSLIFPDLSMPWAGNSLSSLLPHQSWFFSTIPGWERSSLPHPKWLSSYACRFFPQSNFCARCGIDGVRWTRDWKKTVFQPAAGLETPHPSPPQGGGTLSFIFGLKWAKCTSGVVAPPPSAVCLNLAPIEGGPSVCLAEPGPRANDIGGREVASSWPHRYISYPIQHRRAPPRGSRSTGAPCPGPLLQ